MLAECPLGLLSEPPGEAMKVRDLINDTRWQPGRNYGSAEPEVSLLLPTFRRGKDGLFGRSVESILGQTLQDIELIVIDDASTDGTAEQIRGFMEKDPRVSCLTHPRNVGLPAISVYESYVRARGKYIAFAFDDFIFEKDALSRLVIALQERPNAIVHGFVEWFDKTGRRHFYGKDSIPPERLRFHNFLANPSFLIPRWIFDDVGLYDPHIAASRLYDWDLSQRIFEKYFIIRVPVFVGRELGPARDDSIGNSYPLHPEAVQEYFRIPRNAQLNKDGYLDFDVWRVPPGSSAGLVEHVLAMRRYFASKGWAADADMVGNSDVESLLAPKRPVIGIYGYLSASLSFFFDGYAGLNGPHFLYIAPELGPTYLKLYLSRCDAVIMVRELLNPPSPIVVAACAAMEIPLYFFIDDNFAVLEKEYPEFSGYTVGNVAAALKSFRGILCGSDALAELFRRWGLHRTVVSLHPVLDPAKLAKVRRIGADVSQGRLRIGFAGGDFRLSHLKQTVVPALIRMSRDTTLELFTRAPVDEIKTLPFAVKELEYTNSLDEFLCQWRSLGLHVLIHPRGQSENIDFKNANTLLVALYLGAVPIVCSERAFRGVGEEQGVLKIEGESEEWAVALRRVKDDGFISLMLERLENYCRKAFDASDNLEVLNDILEGCPATDVLSWSNRMRKLSTGNVVADSRIARLHAELNSRSFRIALLVRRLLEHARGVAGVIRRN